MIGNKLNRNDKKKGFTLIEILVAVSIFAMIMLITSSIFRNVLTSQRTASDDSETREDVKYFLEIFSREVKGAVRNSSGNVLCNVEPGHIFSTDAASGELYFKNQAGQCVAYFKEVDNDISRLKIQRDADEFFVSSDRINITGLRFVIDDAMDIQPIVTANIQVLSQINQSIPAYDIQTTVSPREIIDCGEKVYITDIAGHTCNSDAPDYDTCMYHTVTIGNQCWIKENLNVGMIIQSTSSESNQNNNGILEKYCYANLSANCQSEGALYQWDEMMMNSATEGSQGICPTGWHVPTDNEYYILEDYLKVSGQACDASRVNTYSCYDAATKMLRNTGFAAPLSGYRNSSGSFLSQASIVDFWSSFTSSTPYFRGVESGAAGQVRRGTCTKDFGLSLRCIKD